MSDHTESLTSIYGLQPRYLGWGRLFKLYVLEDGIAGARVGGQIYDEASGRTQLLWLHGFQSLFLPGLARWIARRRVDRELRCEAHQPGSDGFLAVDRKNFFFHELEIDRVDISPTRAMRTGGAPNSGTLRLVPSSGRQSMFILVGHQDKSAIKRALVAVLGEDRVRWVRPSIGVFRSRPRG